MGGIKADKSMHHPRLSESRGDTVKFDFRFTPRKSNLTRIGPRDGFARKNSSTRAPRPSREVSQVQGRVYLATNVTRDRFICPSTPIDINLKPS